MLRAIGGQIPLGNKGVHGLSQTTHTSTCTLIHYYILLPPTFCTLILLHVTVCVKKKNSHKRAVPRSLPPVQRPFKSRALSRFQTRVLIRIPVFRAISRTFPFVSIPRKRQILFYHWHAKGRRALTIAKLLEEGGIVMSRQGVDASLV